MKCLVKMSSIVHRLLIELAASSGDTQDGRSICRTYLMVSGSRVRLPVTVISALYSLSVQCCQNGFALDGVQGLVR